MAEIATAYVTLIPSLKGAGSSISRQLDGPDVRRAADTAGKSVGSRMGSAFKRVAGPLLTVGAAVAIGRFAKQSVAAFSELEDSTAAAGVVFGKNMGAIIKQSKTASAQMGLSEQQVISAANTFGTYGKAAGLSGKELASFATEQTQLAADMASFKGTSPEEAIEAIGSALRGEMEPIRKYGVLLDDATLRNQALKMGLISTTKDALTPQQKTLAAQAAILEQTTDAQGDYLRTSDSTANVQKRLAAATADLSAKFGKVLAPAFTWVRRKAIDAVNGISGVLDRVLAFREALAAGAGTTSLVKALGLDPSSGFGSFVAKAIDGIKALVAAFQSGTGEVTASGFTGVMEKIGFWVRKAADAIRDAVGNAASGDWSGITDNLKAVWEVARPFGSVLAGVAGSMGDLGTSVGEIIGSGLSLLPGMLQTMGDAARWLADHQGVLQALLVAGAAAFVAYKGAQALANVAALASVPLKVAETASNFVLASSNRALLAARRAETGGAVAQQTVAKVGLITRVREAAVLAVARTRTLAMAAAQKVAAAGQWLLNAAMTANPIGIVIVAVAALVAALVWFFTKTELGKKIVAAAWDGIKTAIKVVADWWTKTAWPAIRVVINLYIAYWKLVFKVVKFVWEGIRAAAEAAWAFLRDKVFAPIKTGIGAVKDAFVTAKDGIGTAFRAIRDGLKAVWTNIRDTIFARFKDGITAVKDAFRTAKDGIATIWDRLKAIAASPVKFVVNTVYNDGIREWWNRIAGAVGLRDLFLPTITLPFAQGTEDHRAQIARAGAMRLWAEPETGGEAYIPLASAKRTRSTAILGAVADRFGYDLLPHADGGFWDRVGAGWSKAWRGAADVGGDVWDVAKRLGGAVWDFVQDPISTVTNGLGALVNRLLGGAPAGQLSKIVTTLPSRFVGGLVNAVKAAFGAEPVGGLGTGSVRGVEAMSAAVRALDPTARITSGYRPGAVTATGVPSYHGLGRAIDIVSGNMGRTWDLLKSRYGQNAAELFYTPKGFLRFGRLGDAAAITRQTHYSHVHWAMRNGGLLYDKGGWMPAGGLGMNLSRRPEAVLDPAESAGLKAALARGPIDLSDRTLDKLAVRTARLIEQGAVQSIAADRRAQQTARANRYRGV